MGRGASSGHGKIGWEIIPAFPKATFRGEIVYDIPGPSIGSAWIASAPKLHLNYVNTCHELPSYGKAKALARLIKAWKYYNRVPVSSFYLEMRCAQHVARVNPHIHV